MLQPAEHIAAAMLAAGTSRRLGQPKQLLPVDGVPLIRRQLHKLLASDYHPVGVVVGHEAGRVIQALAGLPVQFVHNPDYAEGMGSSIAAAARWALSLRPAPAGLLLGVCDQVFLSTRLYDELLRTFRRHRPDAVICRYEKGDGVPVVISRERLPLLAQCRGDKGARKLIGQWPRVVEVPFPKGYIEIDTPDDLDWIHRAR